MLEALQALLGLLMLVGFWWGVFALLHLFEPHRTRPAAPFAAGPPNRREGPVQSGPASGLLPPLSGPDRLGLPLPPQAGVSPCCPDCVQGCQLTGLAMGQAWGRGDDWWGQPFGDAGANTEAMVFWGDGCCPDCATCPICQEA